MRPAGKLSNLAPRLAAVALALVALGAQTQDVRFFRIGTGPPGSSYFPIGGAIAAAISNPPGSRDCEAGGSCGVPGLIAVAQTTRGALANIDAVAAGELDSGLTQSDAAHWAFNGTNVFAKRGAVANLRAIANLYQESLQIVVRRGAGIESIAGLKGKRVSLGEEGSGTLVTARVVLRAYGLGEKRIKAQYLGLAAAIDKMRAKKLDAFFLVAGAPMPAIAELALEVPIDLLAVSGDKAAELRAKYPFLTVDVMPAHTYAGTANTITLGIGTMWVVTAELSEELAYAITKALWHPSTRELLDRGDPIGRKIRFETALSGLPIPLHPGAARYYAEAGAALANPPSAQ